MNKRHLVFSFILATFPVFGEGEHLASMSYWDYHPLHSGGNTLWIGKAPLDSNDSGHLYFRKNNVFLNLLVPISKESYFFPRFDWVNFTLDWDKNLKFKETHFNYTQFGLTFFTRAIDDWRWILRAEYNIDIKHFSHPGTYGLFSGLIWGKYALYEKWNYHVGAFATIGLERTVVYPVIGLDFSPDKHWVIEAIFPIMYSLQYNIDKNWRVSIKGRPLKERYRVGASEFQPRSIFTYSSIGAEFNLRYERFLWLEIELYAGYNFGGNFYIKNQGGHKPLYTDLGGAPYAGASLDYGF